MQKVVLEWDLEMDKMLTAEGRRDIKRFSSSG